VGREAGQGRGRAGQGRAGRDYWAGKSRRVEDSRSSLYAACLSPQDIKAGNVMLDDRMCAKLTDLGVATALAATVSKLSSVGGTGGSPAYMCPEACRAEKPALVW